MEYYNRAHVGSGSIATEPLGAGTIQCLLFAASDQIADRSRMTQRAKSRQSALQQKEAQTLALRGTMILISVNSPGCVSTSIEPACCLTTMS